MLKNPWFYFCIAMTAFAAAPWFVGTPMGDSLVILGVAAAVVDLTLTLKP